MRPTLNTTELREISTSLRTKDRMPTVADFVDQAAVEIDRLRAAMTWQPIETAPKDGAKILLSRLDRNDFNRVFFDICSGEWCAKEGGHWHFGEHLDPPTHWMPLPSAPEAQP